MMPVLSAAHEAFRARVRDILGEIVTPNADIWEEQRRIPTTAWKALGDRGLLNLPHKGPEFLESAIFCEEVGRTGYSGIRSAICVPYMALWYLQQYGSPEQRRDYLEPAQRGEKVAALAISEPNAGSNLARLATQALLDADTQKYRLTGTKTTVTNGMVADFAVAVVSTSPTVSGLAGASVMIADLDDDNAVRRTIEEPLGYRATGLATLHFDGLAVPAGNLLGPRGRALPQLMRGLDFERLIVGILALGSATYTVDLLGAHIRTHMIGDTPLSGYQSVRHCFAELNGQLALVRQYAYWAARQHSLGCLDTFTAATLKIKATELEFEAAVACLHYYGARGYEQNSIPARLYRDAVSAPFTGGTNELLKDLAFEAGGA